MKCSQFLTHWRSRKVVVYQTLVWLNHLSIISISVWSDCCACATSPHTHTPLLQAIRLSLEQALPPEPEGDSGEQISKLRIRTPSGEFLERRFLGSCKLQVLFDFVASKGYPFEEFKLLTTFPRRNVSNSFDLAVERTYREDVGLLVCVLSFGWATVLAQ